MNQDIRRWTMAGDLSIEVQQFIERYVDSLAKLEILLLLRADPSRQWNACDVAKALYYSAHEVCEDQLASLARAALLACTSPAEKRYQYGPGSAELDRLVGDLAGAYQERRVAVITQIYSMPVNKIEVFADAFRLRKEK